MGWSNSSQLLLHYKAEEVDMTTKCRFDCPLCPATLQSGGGGIRTHGGLPHTRSPGVPIRPLSHSSLLHQCSIS